MATRRVQNSTTGTMGRDAAHRTRYEKMETAYGYVPAGAYASGDVLQFTEIPCKHVIHGKFVSDGGDVLEIFTHTSLSSVKNWALQATGANVGFNYIIEYIRGNGAGGKAEPGVSGQLIQLAVTHS